MVYSAKNSGLMTRYDTYEAAEIAAKRAAFNDRDNEFVILESVATTQQPVPQIDVVKL
jgi:hypothetical protein